MAILQTRESIYFECSSTCQAKWSLFLCLYYNIDKEFVGNIKNPEIGVYRIKQAICWQSYSFCAVDGIEFGSGKCSDITMVGAILSSKMLQKR